LGQDARCAVGPPASGVGLSDHLGQRPVCPRPLALGSGERGVVAAPADTEYPAGRSHRVLARVSSDEGVLHGRGGICELARRIGFRRIELLNPRRRVADRPSWGRAGRKWKTPAPRKRRASYPAPRVGFEPTTLRLTAACSTAELPRNVVTTFRRRWTRGGVRSGRENTGPSGAGASARPG